jgi:stage II sporulation protein D
MPARPFLRSAASPVFLGLLFFAVALALLCTTQTGRAQVGRRVDMLSVCLENNVASVTVEGESLHFFDNELDLLLGQSEGKRSHEIASTEGGIAVDGTEYDTGQLRIRSTQGWVRFKGRVFREDLIAVKLPDDPKKLALVNEIQLEGYLYGLINKECLASWPEETKKAQAVAARTYALHKRIGDTRPVCDLESTALDQVYGGYLAEDAAARAAVDATKGEVLTYNNRIAKAFYHANCGGYVASSASVWGDPQPYLTAKPSPWAEGTPGSTWTYTISVADMAKALGVPAAKRKAFRFDILTRSESGRVLTLRLHQGVSTTTITGEKLRKALGYTNLKSTLFTFSIKGGTVRFNGKGMGHGVGMCQWSAAKMAEGGSDYRMILNYFYPGTDIRRLY